MPARSRRPAAAVPAPVAARLLDTWTRLAEAHVPLAAGCSCGGGFGHLRLGDFEEDILDYLRARYTADPELGVLLSGPPADGPHGLTGLLHLLAETPPAVSGLNCLLADLARSIDSFDRLHHGP